MIALRSSVFSSRLVIAAAVSAVACSLMAPSNDELLPRGGRGGEAGHAGAGQAGSAGEVLTSGAGGEPSMPEPCANGVQDPNESDADCGGPSCRPCGEDQGCRAEADCETRLGCVNQVCKLPTCFDNVLNGAETGRDCGGGCDPCPPGSPCLGRRDCDSGVCTDLVCAPPTCTDGVTNGNESDADCGRSCELCGEGRICNSRIDCNVGDRLNCAPDITVPRAGCADGTGDACLCQKCTMMTNSCFGTIDEVTECERLMVCFEAANCDSASSCLSSEICGDEAAGMTQSAKTLAAALFDCARAQCLKLCQQL